MRHLIVCLVVTVAVILCGFALFVFGVSGVIGVCATEGSAIGECLGIGETINKTVESVVVAGNKQLKREGVDFGQIYTEVTRLRRRAEEMDFGEIGRLREEVDSLKPYLERISDEIQNMTAEIALLRADVNRLTSPVSPISQSPPSGPWG